MKGKRIARFFLWLLMVVALGVAVYALLAAIGYGRLEKYRFGEGWEFRLEGHAHSHAEKIMQIYLSQGMGEAEKYASENHVNYVIQKTSGRRLGGNYRSENIQQIQSFDGRILQYTCRFLEEDGGMVQVAHDSADEAEYIVQIAYLTEEQVLADITHIEGLVDDLRYWINGSIVVAGIALAVTMAAFGCLLWGNGVLGKKRNAYAERLFRLPLEKLVPWLVAAMPVWLWGRRQPYVWDIHITWANGATIMLEQLEQCIERMALWLWLLGILLLGAVLHFAAYCGGNLKKRLGLSVELADAFKRAWGQLSWFKKVLIVLLLFCGVEAVGIGLAVYGLVHVENLEVLQMWLPDQGAWIIWALWGLEKVILAALALRMADSMTRLRISGKELAGGNLGYQIPLKGMRGELLQFAQDMNAISHVVADAVEDQTRSEHLKTELITNVSHDIKTPLTSIINYADLIGRQHLDAEKVEEYAQVLYRQSTRLKKLIEDLMEVSKASTGNLEVYLERCQAGVILSQAMGEFEQRLQERGIDLIVRQREEPVWIMADPRMLWRILDNLMTNICKYAQSNTRVYLLLEEREDQAVMTFKNISSHPLEIDAAELMERFVRGDKSRHTEGNGLGLAIARSLMELQGGNMQLTTDGDLFKVMLTFPIAKEIDLKTEHTACITGNTTDRIESKADL